MPDLLAISWQWAKPDQVLPTTSVVTVLLVAVAGYIAWRQLLHASQQRAEEQRPFVVVDMFGSRASIFRIEIKNLGKTIAREVKITFDPQLTSSQDRDDRSVRNIPMLAQGLPSLAPGKRHTFVFDSARTRRREDYPDTYHATVTYKGHDGTQYKDLQVVDLTPYWQTPDIVERDIHDVFNTMAKMRKSLHGIHSALTELTPKPKGPFPALARGIDEPQVIEPGPRTIEGVRQFPPQPPEPETPDMDRGHRP